MTAHFCVEEAILNHHAGSESLVWDVVIKPQNELCDWIGIHNQLLVEIAFISGFKQFLARFRDIGQHGMVQLVVNRDWHFTNHHGAQELRILCRPVPCLIQQMMMVEPSIMARTIVLLLGHISHPLPCVSLMCEVLSSPIRRSFRRTSEDETIRQACRGRSASCRRRIRAPASRQN